MQRSTKQIVQKKESTKTPAIINISSMATFVLIALALLGTYKTDFLYRMQELSLFVCDKSFMTTSLSYPGSFLQYTGAFLTQFFYYPWTGIIIFVTLLCLLALLLYKILNVRQEFFVLCLIPSAMLMLFVTQLDYIVFVLKAQDIIYSQLIGLILSLGLTGVYKLFKKQTYQLIYLCSLAFTYPLLGFYSLLAIALIGLYSIITNKLWIHFGLACLLVAFIPLGYSTFIYNNINPSYAYFAGLPYKDFIDITRMWYPLIIAIIAVLLLTYGSYKKSAGSNKILLLASIAVYLLTMFGVYKFTYKDENFHSQLSMERNIEKNNWQSILNIARKTANPSKPVEIYRNLALLNTNSLCNNMFAYPQKDPYISQPDLSLPTVFGPIALFHYGCLNPSYRWAMEFSVKFGQNVEYLKLMAKIAIYNNEPALAKKYLTTLKQTMFHKKWANEYETYLIKPELLKNNQEYIRLMNLKGNSQMQWDIHNDIKSTLLSHGAYLPGNTRVALELRLGTSMLIKNNQLFWPAFFSFMEQNEAKNIPRHLQEAAVFFAYAEENEQLIQYVTSLLGNNSYTMQNFGDFMQMAEQYGLEKKKPTYNLFKQSFAGTYWFYYYFMEF